MIRKLLIANRGEIAIRIARTAADMGIETLAVAPVDDTGNPHLRHATEQVQLPGHGPAAYLDSDALIAAARDHGCDAVHPGYGFLSESPAFAHACAEAGLQFVGPAPTALEALGNKMSARDKAQSLGIPVVAARSPLRDATDLQAFLAECGAPVMVKSASGGGGRGMRVLRDASDAPAIFTQCENEAIAASGDGALFAERHLPDIRHIEVQLIGDGRQVRHLWDRDCSLQRRHQKILELAPAPGLAPDLRDAILNAAVQLGQSESLQSLATVEFLVEPGATPDHGWYFLEVNPRLQVEHTVTEDWLGLDLVEAQLAIASGQTLAELDLTDQPARGHAMQLRINAERMTALGPVAATGTLTRFQLPGGPGIRVDTHGEPGYVPNAGFDPLLAKLIVSDKSTLSRTLSRARRALSEFAIEGVETNTALLAALLDCPEVVNWSVNTDLVAQVTPDDVTQNAGDTDAITAPMSANIVSIDAEPDQVVPAGGLLAVLEAMKMQHELRAPQACRIVQTLVTPGAAVGEADLLFRIEPLDAENADTVEDTGIDPDHIRPDLQRVLDRTAMTLDASRPEAVKRRRSRNQRTARENLADLTDGAPFMEYGQMVYAAQRRRRDPETLMATSPADGIITGVGHINSDQFGSEASRAALLLYDGSVMAGTQGFHGHKKTDRILEVARNQKLPVVFYTEGGGGRPGDVDYSEVSVSGLDVMTFNLMTRLTGNKPSIGVNSGYCFAGNAAVFGACNIKIATRDSWIGLGGPAMVEAGGLGAHSPKDIGPAPMQAEIGLIDVLTDDEAEATTLTKKIFGYFQGPVSDWSAPDQRMLRHVVPENRKRVYNIREAIAGLVDTCTFTELRAQHAQGMITGFCRIEGVPFGLIANNPYHLGGALDAAASEKGAGFLQLCGRFGMPVIALCDTPGFMVGPESETQGGVQSACALIGAGAAMAHDLFTVVLRKGYGIGAQAMAGGSFAAPAFVISWPTGEFGAMGLEGAVELGYRKELDATGSPEEKQALFDKLVAQFYERGQAMNVASLQEIDAVIDPAETRSWIMNGWRATGRS
ncbi:MAG: carboxyl transferase domain-containing protein [Paracoccaceae bacterium]